MYWRGPNRGIDSTFLYDRSLPCRSLFASDSTGPMIDGTPVSGPGWYLADFVSQDELSIQIPGRPPVSGDRADFELRTTSVSDSYRHAGM